MARQRKLKPYINRRGVAAASYMLPAGTYVIRSDDFRLGLSLRVSEGPHGIGIQIAPFAGSPDITIADPSSRNPELCQYSPDPKPQAFRRWYLHQETDEDIALLGPEYRRNS